MINKAFYIFGIGTFCGICGGIGIKMIFNLDLPNIVVAIIGSLFCYIILYAGTKYTDEKNKKGH